MLRALFWITLFATALLFGQSFAETLGAEAATDENFGHTMVLFLHQLLLVYWLGPDIAVFIWSRHVVNAQLDVEQRIVAGKMMILSETYGLPHPWWQMVGIILLGPVWLTIVLLSYLKRGSDFGDLVARFDLWLRGVLVIGIPISVLWSWSTDRLADSPWIAAKLMILAVVILLGLIMRLRFRAFFDGLNRLEADGQSAAVDTMMSTSLARARPFGHVIWLLLLWASLLGVIKPGEQEPVETAAMAEPAAELVQN